MNERLLTLYETEALLQAALSVKGQPIKAIAEAIGLRPNTIYEWRCGRNRLSAHSLERLLQYLQRTEPDRLTQAVSNQTSIIN